MGRWNGVHGKGAMRKVREEKRLKAEEMEADRRKKRAPAEAYKMNDEYEQTKAFRDIKSYEQRITDDTQAVSVVDPRFR